MSENLAISVYEIVGSPLCVASDDGQKGYEQIAAAMKEGRDVTLSFKNVSSLTSAFLNAAIGQLYATFSEVEVRSHLRVKDLEPEDRLLLKRVVETAKAYFQDPDRFKAAAREVLGESDK